MIVLFVTCKEDVPTEVTSSMGICILLYSFGIDQIIKMVSPNALINERLHHISIFHSTTVSRDNCRRNMDSFRGDKKLMIPYTLLLLQK